MRINSVNQHSPAFAAQMKIGRNRKESVLFHPKVAERVFDSVIEPGFLLHTVDSLSELNKFAGTVGRKADILYVMPDKKNDLLILTYTRMYTGKRKGLIAENTSVNPKGWSLKSRLQNACQKLADKFDKLGIA